MDKNLKVFRMLVQYYVHVYITLMKKKNKHREKDSFEAGLS